MTHAEYELSIDLDEDGLFDTGDNVTSDVTTAGGTLVQVERGRDQARMFAPPRAGGGAFTLNNASGAYSPGGDLEAGRQVRLRAAHDGTTYDLYRGIVDLPSAISVSDFQKRVSVRTLGTLSRLAGKRVSSALYSSITTGEALGHLLDAASYPKNMGPYDVDQGVLGQWTMDGQVGDFLDGSDAGRNLTVTYATGQRGVDAVDDGADGAMTFEEGTTNLYFDPLFQTSGAWVTKEGGAAVTADATVTVDGFTGVKITNTAGGPDYHYVGPSTSPGRRSSIAVGQIAFISCYAKKGSVDYLLVVERADSLTHLGVFNLNTGTVSGTTSASATIVATPEIGAGVYRCTLSFTAGSTFNTSSGFGALSSGTAFYTASGTETVYVNGAQLEVKVSSAPQSGSSLCQGAKGTGYSWSSTAHDSISTRVASHATTAAAALQLTTGPLTVGITFDCDKLSGDGGLIGTGFTGYQLTLHRSGSSGILYFYIRSGANAAQYNMGAASPLVGPHRVVATWDGTTGSNGMKLYLDGTLVAQQASTYTNMLADVLRIGDLPSGGTTFNGTLAGAFVANTEWTQAQVYADYVRHRDAPRHLDIGESTLSWWWVDDEDAFGAMNALLATEGPGAAIYEDGTGAIVFKGRHARLTEPRSTSVQTEFRSSGAEPLLDLPFLYDAGMRDVVNVCELPVISRAAQALAPIWSLGSTVNLAPNETRRLVARYIDRDPFIGAIPPSAADGDYSVTAGSLASAPTLDRTSGARVTLTLVASSSGASVSGLRLRAQLVPVVGRVAVPNRVDASGSITKFGRRTYRYAPRAEVSVNVAEDLANAIVGFYRDGRPSATVTLVANGDIRRMAAALSREVGDRVRVIEGNISFDAEYIVEQVRHELRAPATHVTTLGMELAVSHDFGAWGAGTWSNSIWGW